MRRNIRLVLAALAVSVGTLKAQSCKPTLKISSGKKVFESLIVNKADTVNVSVTCLTGCKIIAEAKGISIRNLGGGKFIFKALSRGEKTVAIYSDCPHGTTTTLNESKTDVSGKRLYAEVKILTVD